MANAQQTERGRMRHAFDAFRADFMKFEEHSYINSHDTSVKSIWSSAMQFMGEVLGTWWTGEDIESPLPNDENLQDLTDRLKNAVERCCSILRTEDMATDIGGFHYVRRSSSHRGEPRNELPKPEVEDLTPQLAMHTRKIEQRRRMPWQSRGKRQHHNAFQNMEDRAPTVLHARVSAAGGNPQQMRTI